MVSFVCNNCQDTIKKKASINHLFKCSGSTLSCIDCNKSFNKDTIGSHTTCVSEAKRYKIDQDLERTKKNQKTNGKPALPSASNKNPESTMTQAKEPENTKSQVKDLEKSKKNRKTKNKEKSALPSASNNNPESTKSQVDEVGNTKPLIKDLKKAKKNLKTKKNLALPSTSNNNSEPIKTQDKETENTNPQINKKEKVSISKNNSVKASTKNKDKAEKKRKSSVPPQEEPHQSLLETETKDEDLDSLISTAFEEEKISMKNNNGPIPLVKLLTNMKNKVINIRKQRDSGGKKISTDKAEKKIMKKIKISLLNDGENLQLSI